MTVLHTFFPRNLFATEAGQFATFINEKAVTFGLNRTFNIGSLSSASEIAPITCWVNKGVIIHSALGNQPTNKVSKECQNGYNAYTTL